MEYTINKLAKLAGVSARTLRYYEEFGLLSPARSNSSGYRMYGRKEVDRLQHILFYRELGVSLDDIKRMLSDKNFDGRDALLSHLSALHAKRKQLDLLIANVEKTISALKGETIMSDEEKFEGFAQMMIDDNEKRYGSEIRGKYGGDAVEKSNTKFRGMTKEKYAEVESLSNELHNTLIAALAQGDPAGESAQKACELHKQWLCCFWDSYSKEAHVGVAQTYVDDPRFTAYYDKIAPGCAVFLRDAILVHCRQ
ncbi:MAG: MerR family transcriptional regulator [Defluviitaleaceae bacterium]|nr:MerR family transcriptional regulator [Defluviitaleaceae bacterium]